MYMYKNRLYSINKVTTCSEENSNTAHALDRSLCSIFHSMFFYINFHRQHIAYLLYGSWEDQRRRQFNKFHNRANCSITSQSRLYRTVSSSITTQIEKLQHVARWLLCATHQCFPRGQPCPRPPKKLLRGSPRKGVCAYEATPMY